MDKYLEDFSNLLDISFPSENKNENNSRADKEWKMTPDRDTWPETDYIHPPLQQYKNPNLPIELKHMTPFYVAPGEFGYFVNGNDFAFESLSFVLTNTQPGGGPPLHSHDVEEAHIVTEGEVLYYLDGRIFRQKGPYVLRIPANVPHTFLNAGSKPFHLIAVFPSKSLNITESGPNPLLND